MRFVAFLAVFLCHTFPVNPVRWTWVGPPGPWIASVVQTGVLGVDLFFVLSAFLITELLFLEWERTGTIAVGRFYLRRLLRIWPLYFAYLAAWTASAWYFLPGDRFPAGDTLSYAVFLGNWAMADHGPTFLQIDHLWSVSVEEQFYLAWPVLLRVVRPSRWHWMFLACIGVALVTRHLLFRSGESCFAFMANTFARLDAIACGALASIALRRWPIALSPSLRLSLFLGGVCGLVLMVHTLGMAPGVDPILGVLLQSGHALCCTAMLVAAVGASDGLLSRFLRHPWMVHMGRISYGLYILHVVFIGFSLEMWERVFGNRFPEGWRVVAFVLTLASALVSYRFIERPFLRLKARWSVIASRPE